MKNPVFWDVMRVALVRTNVSEERSASIIRVSRIDDLGTTIAIASNRRTLRHGVTHQKMALIIKAVFHKEFIMAGQTIIPAW
jgi:hypothetical protein